MVCFDVQNSLFHCGEHFVPYGVNTLFYYIRTLCFPIAEQSVHHCELTDWLYYQHKRERTNAIRLMLGFLSCRWQIK